MARAIIAGAGALPGLLLAAGPACVVRLEGVASAPLDAPEIAARFEQFGQLFADLKAADVTEVAFAGALARPKFDPALMDAETMALMPRIAAAIGQGDDTLLREIAAIFGEQGFTVTGAIDLRPDLVADAGAICGAPTQAQEGDAARARAVLEALGPLDVGQGAIAARGQVIGVETLQGTDAMLRFVSVTAPGSGGVLVKRPKPGQDLRMDTPVIGPDTVMKAAEAGLSGIEIAARSVLILDRDAVADAAEAAGLTLWARA
ncbi:LpxI family protein [Alterinioella nitratireducens]|uniref:LpxI family protein n=1 Tax=Alterinioella nitratireducens TaxID=2735915 RepID=UPI00155280B2|nr:UDP-2,3-diacylglucosamine diphosphatase LpxI [Alterinioella nitratireducens]NPD19099.1 UDP-2,3-diacylglucosamine diphosphatase LpxI [Alterinioella nitratireducens]